MRRRDCRSGFVEDLEALPGVQDNFNEFCFPPKILPVSGQSGRVTPALEPATHSFLGHSSGEGFIEIGVAANKDRVMRQLVENQFCQV